MRKEFNETRIHAAINCASESCPDLRSEAYKTDKLEYQLFDASSNFVNSQKKGVKVAKNERDLKVSKIFKWFGRDFLEKYGNNEQFAERSINNRGVLGFILRYINSEPIKEILNSNDFKVSHMKYDWSLNEQSYR